MRGKFAALLLVCAPAWCDERVFHFLNTQGPAGFKPVADSVRVLTDAQVAVDASASAMTVQGTADQLAMAEWVFQALDKPAGVPPAQHTSMDYPVPNSQDVLRIDYLAHAETPQVLQEMVNVLRSTADAQKVVQVFGPRAIANRGTRAQFGVLEYIIDALDKPAAQPNQHSTTPAMPVNFPRPEEVKIFYLAHAVDPRQIQEMVNSIRSVAELQRVFPFNSLHAIALRGAHDMMVAAEWIFDALDKPAPIAAQHSVSPELRLGPAFRNFQPVARIFFLGHAGYPQDLQQVTNVIRSTADIQRAYPYNALSAITVRGTEEQVALASWLFDSLDQPAQNPGADLFHVAGANDDVARVFYLSHTGTPQGLQELINAVRTGASLQRVSSYWPPKALAVRGTPEQLTAAAKVVAELDR